MSCKKSPVYDVRAVPVDKVVANDYNPNKRHVYSGRWLS